MTKYLQLKQLSVKKSFRRYLIVPLLSLAFLFVVVTHAVEVSNAQSSPSLTPTTSPSPPDGKKAGIKKDEPKELILPIKQGKITNIIIDLKQSKFSLEVQSGNSSPVILSVQEQKLKEILPKLSKGNLVDLDYDYKTKEIKSLSVVGIIRKGTITNIAITPEQSSLEVLSKNSTPVTFSVKEPKFQAILLDLSKGDLVDLDYDYKTNELTSLSVATISDVNWLLRLGIILGSGALFYLVAYLIVNGIKKDWKRNNLNDIFVGQDKRLSNSKSQMAIWFFVVIVSYISFNVLRVWKSGDLGFVGGISIPENLLVLSGISAVTYGGAKVITQSQVNSKPGSKRNAPDNQAGLKDFVTDDTGNTDFGDLQMSFITLIAVVVYLLQFFDFLGTLELQHLVTLPDVDTTILSVFGFSQGAYLAKKTAQSTGAQGSVQFEKGMKGKNVKQFKELLSRNLGIPLSNNDEFDDDTEQAVKQFQSNYNLDSTGIVDRETYKKILLS